MNKVNKEINNFFCLMHRREKIIENRETSIREMWDTVKRYDVHVIAVPGIKGKGGWGKIILEEIRDNAKNFPKLMTDVNPQIEDKDSLQISNRIFLKNHKTPHIYIHHSKTAENKFKNISKESVEKEIAS